MKKLMLPIVDEEWTLFLDRDGTINERLLDDYVLSPDQFVFLPGVLEAIPFFNKIFGKVLIVSNQQGIGKELMTHEDLKMVHEFMMEQIWTSGGQIDQIYYCPDLALYDPVCRKPNPGMAIQAETDFPKIDFRKSIMIGDMGSDILFGNQLEMFTVNVGREVIPDANLNLEGLAGFYELLKTELLQ